MLAAVLPLIVGLLAANVPDSAPEPATVVLTPAGAVFDAAAPAQQPAAARSDPSPDTGDGGGDDEPDVKPPTPPHTGVHALFANLLMDVEHLPSGTNLWIAVIGGAAAIATHPFDASFNQKLVSHHDAVADFWQPGHIVGNDFVQTGAAVATFVYGRMMDEPKVSHLGMDLLQAQIIAGGLTEGLKYAVRRPRPTHTGDPSFPSGHAALTFATATVIERHLGWKMSGLGYAIAVYVATSRLHDNVHYLSDVVFGAAVGTISGRTVTQHGRNAWALAPAPIPGGLAVMITRTSPSENGSGHPAR